MLSLYQKATESSFIRAIVECVHNRTSDPVDSAYISKNLTRSLGLYQILGLYRISSLQKTVFGDSVVTGYRISTFQNGREPGILAEIRLDNNWIRIPEFELSGYQIPGFVRIISGSRVSGTILPDIQLSVIIQLDIA